MNDSGHFIPPSSGRLKAFASIGGFGRSTFLVSGGALIGACTSITLVTASFLEPSCSVGYLSDSLSPFALSLEESFNYAVIHFLNILIPVLLSTFIGGLAGAFIPIAIVGEKKGNTFVPLPKIPPSGISVLILRIFGTVVFLMISIIIIREINPISDIPSTWVFEIGNAVITILISMGLILVFVGITELLIIRHKIYRSLFLNRSEAVRETHGQSNRIRKEQTTLLQKQRINY